MIIKSTAFGIQVSSFLIHIVNEIKLNVYLIRNEQGVEPVHDARQADRVLPQ